MSKLFQILGFLVLVSTSLFAQEKYFHDLRGIEDSTGTTHLFYRVFDPDYRIDYSVSSDHVYHYNTSTESDSVFLRSRDIFPLFSGSYDLTGDFIFLENDPNSVIYISFHDDEWGNYYNFIRAYDESFFHGGPHHFNSIDKLSINNQSHVVIGLDTATIVISLGDSLKLPSLYYEYPIKVKSIVDDPDCEFFKWGCILGASDRVLINNSFTPIPSRTAGDSLIFFQRNDSLFQSFDGGLTKSFLHSGIEWNTIGSISQLSLNGHFLAHTDNRFTNSERDISYDLYTIYSSTDNGISWSELYADTNRVYIAISTINTNIAYFGSGSELFSWDLEDDASKILDLTPPITGLSITESGSLLYILTTDEIIEFNIESQAQTILKVLPVSNENQAEIPKSITLHQNYPNPFNPSTVISYQLTGNSMVSLRVFDALGREVAVLVDELKSAGRHQVTFDAAGLASGVYYYVLNADEQILTKKLTLIK